jgi:Holliday junction resolvase RusA-like endonuclease
MYSFLHFVALFFFGYALCIGVVANAMEVKENGSKKVKKAKKSSAGTIAKVTPNKKTRKTKKFNQFAGNVTVEDQTEDGKNAHFDHPCYEQVYQLSINARMPAQKQRGKAKGLKGMFFDPSATQKKMLKRELQKYLDVDYKLMTGPVLVQVNLYYKIPKHNPTSIKKDDFYGKAPDIDNVQKFLFDVFSGVFYEDDRLVSYVTVCKQYDDHDHCEISIACRRVVGDVTNDDDDASATTDELEALFFPSA